MQWFLRVALVNQRGCIHRADAENVDDVCLLANGGRIENRIRDLIEVLEVDVVIPEGLAEVAVPARLSLSFFILQRPQGIPNIVSSFVYHPGQLALYVFG